MVTTSRKENMKAAAQRKKKGSMVVRFGMREGKLFNILLIASLCTRLLSILEHN